jgi:predicted enzyme related to lactoylglutathione lyase
MRPRAIVSDIIVDCLDPDRVAAFWSALLERPVDYTKGPYVVLSRESDRDLRVSFQRVTEGKVGKNRVHFDISSEDIPATRDLVEALGGRRVDGYESGGFLVMADPEGNEFCIVPISAIEVDDTGRATYLDQQAAAPTGAGFEKTMASSTRSLRRRAR